MQRDGDSQDLIHSRAGRSHPEFMHMSKDVIERRAFRESSQTFSGKWAQACGSLDGLCSKAWQTSQRNWRFVVQLQGYGVIMITERWWDSSYYWNAAIHGSTGQDSKEG